MRIPQEMPLSAHYRIKAVNCENRIESEATGTACPGNGLAGQSAYAPYLNSSNAAASQDELAVEWFIYLWWNATWQMI